MLQEDFYEFFLTFWDEISQGQDLAENFHLKVICNQLQDAGIRLKNREPKAADIIVNIPPSETKSSICSVMWPAWLFAIDPSLSIITGSYSGDLARSLAQKTRDIMSCDKYQRYFPGTRIRKDTSAKSFYATTKGGWRRSVGAGGAITGNHGDVIIIDDPIDPKGVRSEKKMAQINVWMEQTLPSRYKDKSVGLLVLIMQRLSDGDPTERLLKRAKKVMHICLPATDDYPISPNVLRKFYVDGVMNPLRNTRQQLKDLEAALGPVDYPAQYGQSPGSFEGNILKKAYFTVADEPPQEVLKRPCFWTIDTNLKGGSGTDPIGCMRFTVYGGQIKVLNFWDDVMSSPDLLDRLKDEWSMYASKDSIMFIEPKSSGPAITEMLKVVSGMNVTDYIMPANAGKMDRVMAILPRLKAQGCTVYGHYAKRFVEKLGQFPNVKHDEDVDCLTMAFDLTYGTRISHPRSWRIF